MRVNNEEGSGYYIPEMTTRKIYILVMETPFCLKS